MNDLINELRCNSAYEGDLFDRATNTIAALQACEGNGWQDIETASPPIHQKKA